MHVQQDRLSRDDINLLLVAGLIKSMSSIPTDTQDEGPSTPKPPPTCLAWKVGLCGSVSCHVSFDHPPEELNRRLRLQIYEELNRRLRLQNYQMQRLINHPQPRLINRYASRSMPDTRSPTVSTTVSMPPPHLCRVNRQLKG